MDFATKLPLILFGILCGCAAGPQPMALLDPDAPPVRQGDWYRPPIHVAWHLQLQGRISDAHDVDVYDIDLFDTPPEFIDALHRKGRKVFCYFSAGSAESWRPDYPRFRPEMLGAPLEGWPGESWLDIRSHGVFEILMSRMDLAVQKGCDGIDLDNINGYAETTGFDLQRQHQLAFNRNLANAAHRRGLAVVLKNCGGLSEDLVDYFDLVLTESCRIFNECNAYARFVDRHKPVLHVEYADAFPEALEKAREICPESRKRSFNTLILNPLLDGAFRVACE